MNSAGLIADLLRSVPSAPPPVGAGGTPMSLAVLAVPRELAVPRNGIVDAPAAAARQELEDQVLFHLLETSTRIGIDPAPVVQQARAWRYTHADLDEMFSWPPCTFEKHVRLLAKEIAEGFFP